MGSEMCIRDRTMPPSGSRSQLGSNGTAAAACRWQQPLKNAAANKVAFHAIRSEVASRNRIVASRSLTMGTLACKIKDRISINKEAEEPASKIKRRRFHALPQC